MSRSRNPSKILMKKLKVGKMENSTDNVNYFAKKRLVEDSREVKASIISLINNSEILARMIRIN